MPRPFEVEAPAELEDDEAERDVGEDACVVEGILGEPAKNARPRMNPVTMYPVIAGSTRVVAATRPPSRPASSSRPNNAKLLAAGGQAGRKSALIDRSCHAATMHVAHRARALPLYVRKLRRSALIGRIFSPSRPVFLLLGLDEVLARHAHPHHERLPSRAPTSRCRSRCRWSARARSSAASRRRRTGSTAPSSACSRG